VSEGPQTYKFIETPKLPQGFQAYAGKVKENFDWVASGINRLVQLYSTTIKQLAAKAPLENPDFSGRIGVPTVVLDPGPPPVGESWMFVLVTTGTSSDLIIRNNDNGTIRTATISLT